jgi:hypothetical protein
MELARAVGFDTCAGSTRPAFDAEGSVKISGPTTTTRVPVIAIIGLALALAGPAPEPSTEPDTPA